MPRAQTVFLQTLPREDSSEGHVTTHIPSEGYATTAFDLYRAHSISENGLIALNACFTDAATCIALAQLIEGEVSHFRQLEAAETALQVLLLHDCVDVLIPSVKAEYNGFYSYRRAESHRTDLTFELFRPCDPHDHLVIQEAVKFDVGIIASSTLNDSKLIGVSNEELSHSSFISHPIQSACFPAVCGMFELPGYFSNNEIIPFIENRGFFHNFYERMGTPWSVHMSERPQMSLSITLPPLLAVVLSRSINRDSIPEAITQLRAELSPVRSELQEFNKLINSARSEAELSSTIDQLNASFEAIVPAALETNFERRQRTLAEIFTLGGIIQPPIEFLLRLLNPNYQPGPNIQRLVNKTIVSRTFAKLLNMELIEPLCREFFTAAELRNIHRSYSDQDS